MLGNPWDEIIRYVNILYVCDIHLLTFYNENVSECQCTNN